MGFFGGMKTTGQTMPDPASQKYIDEQRRIGMAGANTAMNQPGSFFAGPEQFNQFVGQSMNPYIQNVVDTTRGEFDNMRGGALKSANDQAQAAGAFGGSRHGVMAGARLGEIDRAQGSQVANLMQQGYTQALGVGEHQRQLAERQLQEPLFRSQTALGFANQGMGPVGQQQQQPKNKFGSIMGGAQAGAAFGPWGAAAGGLLGGIFG